MTEPPDDDSSASQGLDSDAGDSFDPLLREAAEALDVSPSAAIERGDPGKLGPEANRISLAEGVLIAGRYRLVQPLGHGGMGEVWAATHTITRRQVAMKFLKGSMSMRADLRTRFLREARAASLVRHPCVVEVLDVFELEDGLPVMVMELLEGETLGDKLARDRTLPVPQVAALILPAVEAVEAAHARGIVHRDLKPDNIFLKRSDAGGVVVKVLDFGIAKLTAKEGDAAETGSLTGIGSVLGTPWYMAPEQLWSEKNIDARADIWALGVILYECLAGRRPLDGSSIGQLVKQMHSVGIVPVEERVPGLDPELARTVGQMLSRERADRQSDLVSVRQLLARLAAHAASTRPPSVDTPDTGTRPAPIDPALDDTHQAGPAKWDTGVPHAVPNLRRAVPPSALLRGRARAVVGVTFVLAGGAGWLLYSSSKIENEAETSAVASSPVTNGAPLASQRAAPAASDVVGIPEAPEPSSVPSQTAGAELAVAAPSSRRSRPAAPRPSAVGGAPGSAEKPEPPSVASAVPPPEAPPRRKRPGGGLFDEVPF